MRDAIIEKLSRIIFRPAETEERVVYLLVEIRKLIEHSNLEEDQFVTLRFFCNWAVHTRLTRGEGAKIVALLNDLFEARLNGRLMGDEQRQKLSDIFSFETFRRELLDFLRSQGLWFSAMEILPHWVKFVELYASVVADCPIVHTKKDLQLRWMDRAVMSAYQIDDETMRQIRAESPYAECSFGLRWTFHKGEKQVLRWELPLVFEDYDRIHDPNAPPREDVNGDSTPSG